MSYFQATEVVHEQQQIVIICLIMFYTYTTYTKRIIREKKNFIVKLLNSMF
jgi:hypothetical protein